MMQASVTRSFQRYAIYWVPEPGSALAKFGECWFANGSDSGTDLARETFGLPHTLACRATKAPSHYGIHATLKAPFRLRENTTEAELQGALEAFCAARRRVTGGPLKLSRFQGYLGLVLSNAAADADWLAEQCVILFDRFRAPLDETDRQRREIGGMNPAEGAFFEAFGYPYVLSEFQFHVSLAGPLDEADLEAVEAALGPPLRSFEQEPLRIESLCLLGEPQGDGNFTVISRHRFRS